MQKYISLNITEQAEFKSKNSHDEYFALDIRLSFYKEIIDAEYFCFILVY